MANADLLSQDEIDALLSGVDSGDVDTTPEDSGEPGSARNYDFASQDRIVRGRMPTLEMINERFARNMRIRLFNMLRRSPVISVEGVQMVKFGEYVHTLLMPSNMNVIRIKQLRGSALIVCNPKLVFSLVDCFFGGDGRFHTKIEGRDFTGTEMRIIRKVLEHAFASLTEAWEPVMPVDFEYVGSEINPSFANIVSPSEVVVVSQFHIDLEGGAGYLHVTMPYSMVEPIRELLDAGVQSDSTEKDLRWCQMLQDEVKSAPIEVNSMLTTVDVSIGDILKLRPGDVLPIELPETVVARVDDVPVFRAKYGVSRGNLALKVTQMMHHSDLTPRTPEVGV
ncbi:MAG: flagellar motor switch protein FliM [Gammaproteobacteria bacterium]|nr:flagellar motor switch protein FliM [Gammaproteobacteria bacterium]MBI5615841.1 flagellar motor switch protein FliM [Gammaproteobacteria bacterium]